MVQSCNGGAEASRAARRLEDQCNASRQARAGGEEQSAEIAISDAVGARAAEVKGEGRCEACDWQMGRNGEGSRRGAGAVGESTEWAHTANAGRIIRRTSSQRLWGWQRWDCEAGGVISSRRRLEEPWKRCPCTSGRRVSHALQRGACSRHWRLPVCGTRERTLRGRHAAARSFFW
jgi:hypothetical protein